MTTLAARAATEGVADPAAELLARQTPAARALMEQLRALVREVVPRAREQVHMGWEVIVFSPNGGMRDMIAALAPRTSYVNIQFGKGTLLPDPQHKLEGTGKLMRHVKIRSTQDVQDPAVRALIEASAAQCGL